MKIYTPFLLFILFACSNPAPENTKKSHNEVSIDLTQQQAEKLVRLPLKCMQQEYPNNLEQVVNSDKELQSPQALHPAFYGCFDWHSAVHGDWLLVKMMRLFPNLSSRDTIRQRFNVLFTEKNIKQEMAFFDTKYNNHFERTYGWAWLFQLYMELDVWEDKDAKNWSKILKPLVDLVAEHYKTYLPKLIYPLRNGTHTNTAFGLTFAYDYAVFSGDEVFRKLIEDRAKSFYLADKNSPLNYEPSGYDFLSPSFEEVDLMRRILGKDEFMKWLDGFLPGLKSKKFELAVGVVGDRSDGHLVHLDGLNFSRAWCLFQLGKYDKKYSHLIKIAQQHLAYSLPSIVDGDYMGEHWLATFAVSAMVVSTQ